MNRWILAFTICAVAQGQGLRLMRGQVTEMSGTALTIRDTLLRANRCELPGNAERLATNGALQAPALVNGAYVEAIVEVKTESAGQQCFIRTLYIRPPHVAIASTATRTSAFLDNLFPRGNLTYTGTVQNMSDGKLELRSRRGVVTEFTVRDDTTYSTGGRVVHADDLAPQTVVQVRAGRTFAGDLEVYQILWGGILPGR